MRVWMWGNIIKYAVRSWIIGSQFKQYTGEVLYVGTGTHVPPQSQNQLQRPTKVSAVFITMLTPSWSQKKKFQNDTMQRRCEAKTHHWLRRDQQCIPSFLEGGCFKLVVFWKREEVFFSQKQRFSDLCCAWIWAPGYVVLYDQTDRRWERSGEQEFTSSSL